MLTGVEKKAVALLPSAPHVQHCTHSLFLWLWLVHPLELNLFFLPSLAWSTICQLFSALSFVWAVWCERTAIFTTENGSSLLMALVRYLCGFFSSHFSRSPWCRPAPQKYCSLIKSIHIRIGHMSTLTAGPNKLLMMVATTATAAAAEWRWLLAAAACEKQIIVYTCSSHGQKL